MHGPQPPVLSPAACDIMLHKLVCADDVDACANPVEQPSEADRAQSMSDLDLSSSGKKSSSERCAERWDKGQWLGEGCAC